MKPFRAYLAVIVLLALAGLCWFALRSKTDATKPAAPTVVVEVATVEARDVPVWLTGVGTVEANNTVTVRPRVSGTLDSIHFTEGQYVKSGDLLAQIDPRPYQAALNEALAQNAQAEARLANERREYERVRDLVTTHSESQQQLDLRASTLAQATAQLQASQAAVENARLQLEFTTLRSPIDGHTGVRLIDAGNLVSAGQNGGLVVITQTQPIAVVFNLPQHSLLDLQLSRKNAGTTPLPVEALNETGTLLAQGHLDLIDNQIDSATGTLRLKARFPNTDQTLWPGQFVNARVLLRTLPAVPTLPAESIKPGVAGPYVYVIKPDSTVEARTIQTGPTVDNRTVITTGLAIGERVVRVGQNKLKPGARITTGEPSPQTAHK